MNPAPGAPVAGDEYYPNDGNGGYDALDYHVNIGYETPARGTSTATRRSPPQGHAGPQPIRPRTARTRGLASVRVDGKQAKFTREGAVTSSGFVDQA
jgi:hypothetical protein